MIGAGKVGCELPGMSADDVPYQISQRADFFEEEVGLETTLKRPIVNTRDEPHCDASKYRRLHVIVGDANMSEVATYLKVGTTAIVLADDRGRRARRRLAARQPGGRDPPGQPRPDAARARSCCAAAAGPPRWRCSGALLERARKYERSHGLSAVGEAVGADVLARWESVLAGLENDISTVADIVDWVAKQRLIDGYAERHSLSATDARLKALDLQYHDLRPTSAWLGACGLHTLIDDDDVEHRQDRATDDHPRPTSAAAAWPSGRPTSSPRTGTAWCSTSAAIRCAGCR